MGHGKGISAEPNRFTWNALWLNNSMKLWGFSTDEHQLTQKSFENEEPNKTSKTDPKTKTQKNRCAPAWLVV
jgi:hypothetical protein